MEVTRDLFASRRRSASDESVNQQIDWSQFTFLVVEDTPSNFNLIHKYLYKTGVNILHAENGIEAIELVKRHPEIAIVLMDIKLPELNGLKATSAIKQIRPYLIVIAQTAYAMESDRELCLNAGCDGFLAKPYRKHELLELVIPFL